MVIIILMRKNSNVIIERSVFAGVKRNSLSFNTVSSIFNGETIIIKNSSRFYRSFKDLVIKIKPSKIAIQMNHDKKLVNNKYIPLNIYNLNHDLDNRSLFTRLKNRINRFIKKFINPL
jgi:hypothetical protein